jgi:hypothetical protein
MNTNRPSSDIHVNSVHVPVAVALWRLPNLIGYSVLAAIVGVAAGTALYGAWLFVRNTGAFDSLERQRMDYAEVCMANTRLQFPNVSSRRIYDACKAKSVLYKAELRQSQGLVSN